MNQSKPSSNCGSSTNSSNEPVAAPSLFQTSTDEETDISADTTHTFSSLNLTNENINMSFECELPVQAVSAKKNDIDHQIHRVLTYHLKHNTTSRAAEESAKLINQSPGVRYLIPETKYLLQKNAKAAFFHKYYVKCTGCDEYTSVDCNINGKPSGQCSHCMKNITRDGNNHFAFIPVVQQLRESISRNWHDIMVYADARKLIDLNADQTIYDVHDGKTFQDIQRKYPDIFNLSMTINTDGVKLFDKTIWSLWPILAYQNFLPPKIRYVTDNILLIGLIYVNSEKSLDFKRFFLPFVQEMIDTHEAGGFTIKHGKEKVCFRLFVTHNCCDLPAKAMLQGTLRFCGYHACGYCHHPGVSIKNRNNTGKYCRYVKRDPEDRLRSHEEVIMNLEKIANGSKSLINGFNSLSCMVAMPEFDMVNGYGIDYMHCIAIGIANTLWDLWLSPKNAQTGYYLNKDDQQNLNERILSIKPLSEFKRSPKSLRDRGTIQANDRRWYVLYYLRYSLSGILAMQYVTHFQLLSAATYTLSKKSITKNEIECARVMLTKFADDFEKLYGRESVTMNVHLLRHMPDAVIHLGPLWAQSLFGFEAMNGVLSRMVKSPMQPIQQIVGKYIMRMSLKADGIDSKLRLSNVICSFENKKITPTTEQKALFLEKNIVGLFQIWKRIQFNGVFYTSIVYRDTKSIDYFVLLSNKAMGKIKYFIEAGTNVYALVEIFKEQGRTDHLVEVISDNSFSVFSVTEIVKKLLYFKMFPKEIVCEVANNYEKS